MAVRINLSAHFGRTQNTGGGWLNLARNAESIGYDTLVVADHLVPGGSVPFTAMASAAAVTDSLRVGSYVLNNDFRHPVVVAHEIAALADLSGGRAVLGVGAGHMQFEYDQAGFGFDSAAARVARMTESAEVLRRLLAGESVRFEGEYYSVKDHQCCEAGAPRVPLLIGGNGTKVLQTAGSSADIIGVTGATPNRNGSDFAMTHFTEAGLADRIAVARAAAGDRWPLPVDVLVQVVIVTNRAQQEAERLAGVFETPVDLVRSSPFVLIGSVSSIVDRIRELNATLGVDALTVFKNRPESDQTERTMAPIIEALAE